MKFLNTILFRITQDVLLESLYGSVLVAPNVDCLVKLQKDRELYGICQKAEWAV